MLFMYDIVLCNTSPIIVFFREREREREIRKGAGGGGMVADNCEQKKSHFLCNKC